MADNDPDIAAREVDEALRRERMQALWKENGKYVYGVAALVVLIVAGREIYTSQVDAARQAQAVIYGEAQNKSLEDQTDIFGPVKAWEEASEALNGNYQSLATLRLAAAKLDAGDVEGAIQTYDALSRLGSIEEPVRDLARLLAAMTVADGLGEMEDALDRLQLVTGADRPWRYSAREQEAYVLLELGRVEEARSIVDTLSFEQDVPPGIRERATALRDALPAPVVEPASQASEGNG